MTFSKNNIPWNKGINCGNFRIIKDVDVSENSINSYIIGVLLGDGFFIREFRKYRNYKKARGICLNTIDKDFALYFAEQIKKICPSYKISIKFKKSKILNHNDIHRVQFYSFKYAHWLENITNNKKEIPDWIEEGDFEIRQSFLEGIFDSEGYIRKSGATIRALPGWMFRVRKIIQSLNIRCSKKMRTHTYGNGNKLTYEIYLNVNDLKKIGFNIHIKRKQDILNKI